MTNANSNDQIYAISPRIGLSNTEVFLLICSLNGKSYSEIADALGLSDLTIKLYADSICKKLDARNFTAATAKAMDFGLVNL